MEKEELYPYGPILDRDQNEITVYLDATRLTKEEIEKLDNEDDEFLLEGGQVQSFYVSEQYIDHITIYRNKEEGEKVISFEEYLARINGCAFRDVDHFTKRKWLPDEVRYALDDAVGNDCWDGAINYNDSEYYAVIKKDQYYKTYSVTLQAKEV